jgi:amidohydrolase
MTDTRDPLVISVGIIEGGTAFNIIPEQVRLVGTIRTHDPEFRIEIREKLKNVVNGICSSFGASAKIVINPGAPVNYNNPELTGWAVNVMNRVFGEDKVHLRRPSMGAEDFAYYSLKIPAYFYSLGVRNEAKGYIHPAHNPRFIADENSIEYGVEAMTNLVLNFLKSKEKF